MASLKGRLPQKLKSKSILSCEIIQIQSVLLLFYKETEIKIENRCNLFLRDGFRKTDLGIDLIANDFRGSIYFLLHHLSFILTEGGLFLLTCKGWFELFIVFIQRMVSLNGHSIQYKMLLGRLQVYRSIKYLKIVMLTSPGFFLKE